MLLRPARADEALQLTELCLRSKAVWGYDEAFLAACRAELTIEAELIDPADTQVAEIDHDLAGFAQVRRGTSHLHLDKLYVEPTRCRSGIGRALFAWVVETARRLGSSIISIDADPNARAFYERLGAVHTGFVASGSIPGRFIPRMTYRLPHQSPARPRCG